MLCCMSGSEDAYHHMIVLVTGISLELHSLFGLHVHAAPSTSPITNSNAGLSTHCSDIVAVQVAIECICICDSSWQF